MVRLNGYNITKTRCPKGQVTIPKKYRDLCQTGNFAFEISGKTIILKPVEIKIIEDDELKDFSSLGLSAFDFWNCKEDDVYDEFYKNKKKSGCIKG